jgi:hypothetical protein
MTSEPVIIKGLNGTGWASCSRERSSPEMKPEWEDVRHGVIVRLGTV